MKNHFFDEYYGFGIVIFLLSGFSSALILGVLFSFLNISTNNVILASIISGILICNYIGSISALCMLNTEGIIITKRQFILFLIPYGFVLTGITMLIIIIFSGIKKLSSYYNSLEGNSRDNIKFYSKEH